MSSSITVESIKTEILLFWSLIVSINSGGDVASVIAYLENVNNLSCGGGPSPTPPAPTPPTGGGQSCSNLDNDHDYRGRIDTTESGFRCQRWNSQTPHQH